MKRSTPGLTPTAPAPSPFPSLPLCLGAPRLVAAALLALAIPGLAAATVALALASGELAAGRNDTLVCSGINLAGVDNEMHVFLRDPTGGMVVQTDCTSVPDGESCTASVTNPSPIPLVAYCYVTARHSDVAGALRVDNPNRVSKAVSDLRPLS